MAPLRRRISRRVVKTTFDECFEYDIPGFRSSEVKRASVSVGRSLARSTINSINKTKSRQESTPKIVKVPSNKKAAEADQNTKEKRKEKSKDVSGKEETKVNKLSTRSSGKITKVKGSDISYKKKALVRSAFKSETKSKVNIVTSSKTKPEDVKSPNLKESTSAEHDKKKHEDVKSPNLKESTSAEPDIVLESRNWQPRVHLEKLNLNKPGMSKSSVNNTEISPKKKLLQDFSSKSPDLATRLKNALKDPMAEKDDHESGSSDILTSSWEEILTSPAVAHVSNGTVSQQDSDETVREGKAKVKNSTVKEACKETKLRKQHGSDSALEDWPESSSEASDVDDADFTEDILSELTFPSIDWASSQVSQIFKFQDDFKTAATDLQNSFEYLRNIIEKKSSLIVTLRKKLSRYTNSTCHQILDRILLDYDKSDFNNPATVIVKSIIEYDGSPS